MVSTLLRFVGIDLRRMAREAAVTLALIACGAFAAILAFAFGFTLLYLWLDESAPSRRSAFWAERRRYWLSSCLPSPSGAPRKPRAYAEDALRAAAAPAAGFARTADEAVKRIAEIVGNGSRQQIIGTIAATVLIGWGARAPILDSRGRARPGIRIHL